MPKNLCLTHQNKTSTGISSLPRQQHISQLCYRSIFDLLQIGLPRAYQHARFCRAVNTRQAHQKPARRVADEGSRFFFEGEFPLLSFTPVSFAPHASRRQLHPPSRLDPLPDYLFSRRFSLPHASNRPRLPSISIAAILPERSASIESP